MWETLKTKLSNWYSSLKDWFKRSETIFWARIQTITGFLTSAIAGIDWTTLFNSGFKDLVTNKTILYVGLGILVNGLFTEYLRRRNSDL